MSILASLYTGASGLGAHGDAISVVGDNIANTSTIGYRSSRASFEDVLGGRAMNSQSIGNGVRMSGPETLFGQGTLQQTGSSLDLAIRGDGFFAVSGSHDGLKGTYYTRDGRFHLDNSGSVVNSQGLKLQGFLADATGKLGTSAADLVLAKQESPPSATTKADVAVNLEASTSATPPPAWDPTAPASTSSYSTSTTVYDSLGAEHRVDMYFHDGGGGSWDWHAMVDGGEIQGGAAGTPTEIATGTLSFNGSGALDNETATPTPTTFVGTGAAQSIAFDFGDSITGDGGSGLGGSTQFAAPSTVSHIDQDGYSAGTLIDVNVSDDGTVTGKFSNGQMRTVAQVALAHVASEQGLERVGNQLFAATQDSGEAVLGAAGTGGRGSISGGALEGSNVDLGNELVTLIAYQRAFQASARTVTTADEMLTEVSNLKR